MMLRPQGSCEWRHAVTPPPPMRRPTPYVMPRASHLQQTAICQARFSAGSQSLHDSSVTDQAGLKPTKQEDMIAR